MKRLTSGRWREILEKVGVPNQFLTKKNSPCPMCGGKDRYRWTDWKAAGRYICNQCGNGDGFDLISKYHDIPHKESYMMVGNVVGFPDRSYEDIQRGEREKQKKKDETQRRRDKIREVLSESRPAQLTDAVGGYLTGRGLETIPSSLLIHPNLFESETGKEFVAMIARAQTRDGKGSTIHRTYIKDYEKAPIKAPRKMMSSVRPVNGSAIRLFPIASHIGIAEGIETAIAAHEMFHLPVWSVMNAGGMASFDPPPEIKTLSIFADNDENYTGQKAAYELANKLSLKNIDVIVYIPTVPGDDWLDDYNKSQARFEAQRGTNVPIQTMK